MFNYQSLSGINKDLTLPNADQCHRFIFHYFDTYKIKGILFGALGYLEYPFLLRKVIFPQFFLFFQSSLAENQECLRWSTPFYSLWNISLPAMRQLFSPPCFPLTSRPMALSCTSIRVTGVTGRHIRRFTVCRSSALALMRSYTLVALCTLSLALSLCTPPQPPVTPIKHVVCMLASEQGPASQGP
jgi:hypothetical protein